MAERIQRQRERGYRLPAGAIYVGRPSRWGNPWTLGNRWLLGTRPDGTAWEAEDVVRWFRTYALARMTREPDWLEPLRGHDLACWCPVGRPCHGDTLLELANL